MYARQELPTPFVVDNSQSFLSWGDSWNLQEAAVSTVLSCWGFSFAWVSGLFWYESSFLIQSESQQLIPKINIIVHHNVSLWTNWPKIVISGQPRRVGAMHCYGLFSNPAILVAFDPHSFIIYKLFEGNSFSFFIAILLCYQCLKSQCSFSSPYSDHVLFSCNSAFLRLTYHSVSALSGRFSPL